MRLPICLLVACGLLAAVPVGASAEPQASAVPGLSSGGQAILRGADDAMWIVEPADPGAIARVTTAGAVTEFKGGATNNFDEDRYPEGLAMTTDATVWPAGMMWFLLTRGRDELGRITTGGAVDRSTVNGGRPTSLTGGPDGRLWMTIEGDDDDDLDAIVRQDTSNATVRKYLSATSNPHSLTTGPDGALWFIVSSGWIGRLTTAGELTWQNVGGAPSTLAADPFGTVWLARGATVTRLSDRTNFATGTAAKALATGPDGALWAAMTGAVARIEPGGATTIHRTGLPPGAQGQGIAAGPDGRMWMTLKQAPYLVRITVPPRLGSVDAAADSPTTGSVTVPVSPNGLDTQVVAELQQPDGTWQSAGSVHAGAGTAAFDVALALSGLTPGGSRLVRVTATNAAGTITSAGVELATAPQPPDSSPEPPAAAPTTAAPVPEPEPEPAVAAKPVPVQGKSVVLTAGSGTVRIKAPGQAGYTTLASTSDVPVNSLIDTTKGSVVLSSRIAGKTQSGAFRGGLFRVRQARTGMTELRLAGALDCGPRRASAAAASKPKPRKRRVWGQDRGGQFQTHGRSSVATVRGTRWLTEDTCTGTRVRVTEGAVSVKPKGRRAVVVRAGGSQFTRHRG